MGTIRTVPRHTGALGWTAAEAHASWVLECDWPGIDRLGITADQIRRGGAEARHTAVELLLAGLQV